MSPYAWSFIFYFTLKMPVALWHKYIWEGVAKNALKLPLNCTVWCEINRCTWKTTNQARQPKIFIHGLISDQCNYWEQPDWSSWVKSGWHRVHRLSHSHGLSGALPPVTNQTLRRGVSWSFGWRLEQAFLPFYPPLKILFVFLSDFRSWTVIALHNEKCVCVCVCERERDTE